MKRRIILFLILFVSFVYSASSLKTFEIDETEKLSLGIKTDDPDADNLVYTFTEPLDDNGEWQTTYGDVGEYTAVITVSDGENQVSEEILIIVHKKEAEPSIDSFAPKEAFIAIDEGGSVKFEIAASDLNDEELTYKWLLDGDAVSDNKEFLFETDYEDNGEYTIKFTVSDGTFNVSKEWDVNVNDVALDNILEQIEAISVLEGETASLKL
ncbi:MAG: PKD domain-containing protein, partial [Candidatus Woesearchaeota archaeon]|nr:PKD domain-containing protein [Candidatus Woesearchaeota archaeon]